MFFDLDMHYSEKEILDTLVYMLIKKDLSKRHENVVYSINLKLLEKIEGLLIIPSVQSYRFVQWDKYGTPYQNSNSRIHKENYKQKY